MDSFPLFTISAQLLSFSIRNQRLTTKIFFSLSSKILDRKCQGSRKSVFLNTLCCVHGTYDKVNLGHSALCAIFLGAMRSSV